MSSTTKKTADSAETVTAPEAVFTPKPIEGTLAGDAVARFLTADAALITAGFEASKVVGPWILDGSYLEHCPLQTLKSGKEKPIGLDQFSADVLKVPASTLRQWMKLHTLNLAIEEPVTVPGISDELWRGAGSWKDPEAVAVVVARLEWMRAAGDDSMAAAKDAVVAIENDLDDPAALEAFREAEAEAAADHPSSPEADNRDPAAMALKGFASVLKYLAECDYEQARSTAEVFIGDLRKAYPAKS